MKLEAISIITIKVPSSPIIDMASDELPADLMNLFFLIISILIIILILIVIFLVLIMFWLKRQGKIHYPVKSKIIMKKERSLVTNEPAQYDANIKSEEKLMKAKPVNESVKSKKLTAVTPIRISSARLSELGLKLDTNGKIKSIRKPEHSDSKPIAKPVQQDASGDAEKNTKTTKDMVNSEDTDTL